MSVREEYYSNFGPKLVEAIVLVILDEVNAIRSNAGLSARTVQQMLDAIDTKLAAIPDYDGMNIS